MRLSSTGLTPPGSERRTALSQPAQITAQVTSATMRIHFTAMLLPKSSARERPGRVSAAVSPGQRHLVARQGAGVGVNLFDARGGVVADEPARPDHEPGPEGLRLEDFGLGQLAHFA